MQLKLRLNSLQSSHLSRSTMCLLVHFWHVWLPVLDAVTKTWRNVIPRQLFDFHHIRSHGGTFLHNVFILGRYCNTQILAEKMEPTNCTWYLSEFGRKDDGPGHVIWEVTWPGVDGSCQDFFLFFCVNFPNHRHFMVENAFVKLVNFIEIKFHICLWKYLSSRLLVEYWRLFFFWNHCSDITWVPQINRNLMHCLTAGRVNNKEIPDLHITDVCKGNLAVTDGFSHKVQEM